MRENEGMLVRAILGLVAVLVVTVIAFGVFYLLTLQRALSRVAPRNRLMEPAAVWLALIPLLNLVWNFFLAIQVPASLRNEFRERGRRDDSDYGRGVGLAYAVLSILCFAFEIAFDDDVVPCCRIVPGARMLLFSTEITLEGRKPGAPGLLMLSLGLALLVLLVLFWVKIIDYSRQLAADPRRDAVHDPASGSHRSSAAIRPDDRDRYKS